MDNTTKADKTIALVLILVLAFPVAYFSLFVPFETDTGDSVMHYYFARYAFQDPLLLLDHWGKPFFTLLASPFAQFGFGGMKLFNGIAGLLSGWIAYRIASKLELRYPWMAILFVLFAPAYFVKLFSGYTEPLFGLILVISIYLVLIQRPLLSATLLSFLPFVRSEGLILVMVFSLYFLIRKNYKAILLLPAGHVIYSFIGMFSGKSFLWVFTDIPYSVVSPYGKGNFTHYSTQLLLTLGVPLFLLCIGGILTILMDIIIKWSRLVHRNNLEVHLLLFGSFLAYFLFHTLSWGLGLFGSMGLSRVLTAMVPLLAVISLIGFNFLISWKSTGLFPLKMLVIIPLTGYVLIFPFLHNPASINWKKELHRSPEMTLMHRIASDINKQQGGKFLYYSNPYLSYALNINPFDQSKHATFSLWHAEGKLHPASLLIWDNWSSVDEEQTDSTSLYRNPELRLVRRYETDEESQKKIFLVFSN